MCCIFHSSHNILRLSKDTIKFVLIYKSKKHPSFDICRLLGKIQHMFMYINTLMLYTIIIYSSKKLSYVISLIIYSPKTLPIFHHVVNKSAQGEQVNFEINCVILRQSQIRVCTPLSSNKYRLYIGVY